MTQPLVSPGQRGFYVSQCFQLLYIFRYGSFVILTLVDDLVGGNAFTFINHQQDGQLSVSQVKGLQLPVIILLCCSGQYIQVQQQICTSIHQHSFYRILFQYGMGRTTPERTGSCENIKNRSVLRSHETDLLNEGMNLLLFTSAWR